MGNIVADVFWGWIPVLPLQGSSASHLFLRLADDGADP